ncbi:MAG: hypothetical protein IKD87_03335 [Oscillospiraceae bacterium]|nr:hypothetical protein [Oscillospiraceae bacterium]
MDLVSSSQFSVDNNYVDIFGKRIAKRNNTDEAVCFISEPLSVFNPEHAEENIRISEQLLKEVVNIDHRDLVGFIIDTNTTIVQYLYYRLNIQSQSDDNMTRL